MRARPWNGRMGWMLCVLALCLPAIGAVTGCDDGGEGAAVTQEEVDRAEAKYAQLAREVEQELYPRIRDLEQKVGERDKLREQVDELQAKLRQAQTSENSEVLEKLRADLAQREQENERLLAELKKLRERAELAGGDLPPADAGQAEGDPGNAAVLARAHLLQTGEDLISAGEFVVALRTLERAVDLGADTPRVLHEIAWLYGRDGRNGEAEKWCARAAEAVRRTPGVNARLAAKVYSNYGATLVALERYDEALGWYEKAVAVDEKYPAVYLNLALLYDRHLGEPEKALEAYRRHVALGGTRGVGARDAIYRLQHPEP